MAIDQEQYAICQARGHTKDPDVDDILDENKVIWHFCKYCGVQYRIGDPEVIEVLE